MAAQCHAEDSSERQQQGKRGEEGVVGQQRHQVSGFVVAELLDDRDGERDHRMPLLPAVEPPHEPFWRARRHPVSVGHPAGF